MSAQWGWTNVPNAIKQATILQGARLYERRNAVFGPLTRKDVDDVSYQWGSTVELHADVAAVVAPYRRVWGAV